jgi:hypothetical protein
VPVKSAAEVIADRPGISTCPGESRSGSVSLRLSCAVNPFAAHAATPRDPLPSGSDCASLTFGCWITMSERLTTPPTSSANAPSCQAVVGESAKASGA